MKIPKYLLIVFLFLILLSVNIFSFSNAFNWGNQGYDVSGAEGYLFSSGFPQTDTSLNFTRITISDASAYPPVLFNNILYQNTDTESKFLYLVYGNTISMYESDTGNLYSSYTNSVYTSTAILCQPHFYYDNSVNSYKMIVFENTTSGMKLSSNFMTSVSQFAVEDYIDVPNTAKTCYYDLNSEYYNIMLSNGTIMTYEISDSGIDYLSSYNTETAIPQIVGAAYPTFTYTYPYYSNLMSAEDINFDGHDDLLYAIPYRVTDGSYTKLYIKFGIRDIYNNANILSPVDYNTGIAVLSTSALNGFVSANTAFVKTGNMGSQHKIYLHGGYTAYFNPTGTTSKTFYNYVFSTSGSNLYAYNPFSLGTDRNSTYLTFTDYNFDGSLESCYGDYNKNLICMDSTFNNVFSIANFTSTNPISTAKLTDDAYINFIDKKAIYSINGTNLFNIYNFSYNNYGYVLPLSLINKNNYSNDVMAVYSTFTDTYQLREGLIICGDNICSFFETALTCAADCFTQTEVTELLDILSPCTDDSDCMSGLCDIGKCILKGTNDECTADTQCLSGECINNVCKAAGIFAEISQMKNQAIGESEFDGTVLFIIFIIIVFAATLYMCYALGSVIPVFLGLFACFTIFISFAAFSWLPAWLILSFIIILIAAVILMFFLFGNKGG